MKVPRQNLGNGRQKPISPAGSLFQKSICVSAAKTDDLRILVYLVNMTLGRCPLGIFCSRGTPPLKVSVAQGGGGSSGEALYPKPESRNWFSM